MNYAYSILWWVCVYLCDWTAHDVSVSNRKLSMLHTCFIQLTRRLRAFFVVVVVVALNLKYLSYHQCNRVRLFNASLVSEAFGRHWRQLIIGSKTKQKRKQILRKNFRIIKSRSTITQIHTFHTHFSREIREISHHDSMYKSKRSICCPLSFFSIVSFVHVSLEVHLNIGRADPISILFFLFVLFAIYFI